MKHLMQDHQKTRQLSNNSSDLKNNDNKKNKNFIETIKMAKNKLNKRSKKRKDSKTEEKCMLQELKSHKKD